MSFLVVKVNPAGFQKKPLIIAIGTRVSKKAVERNLIKRRIRAIMQPAIKKKDKNYLIIARPEVKRLTYQELKKELENKIYG